MLKFERDFNEIKRNPSDGIYILKERKSELDELYSRGRREKNGFRRDCIAYEYSKLLNEYNILSDLV